MVHVPVFGDPQWIQKASHPRCRECGTSTSKPATCFFCGEITCPKCTRQETWGGKLRTVCKGCREAGRELDAEIKHEEQARKAHEKLLAKLQREQEVPPQK